MDYEQAEAIVSEVTGELGPFDDLEDIIAGFEAQSENGMAFRAFVANWRNISCSSVACVNDADGADVGDEQEAEQSDETTGAPKAVPMEADAAVGVASASYLDKRHIVEGYAAEAAAKRVQAKSSAGSVSGILTEFEALENDYAGLAAPVDGSESDSTRIHGAFQIAADELSAAADALSESASVSTVAAFLKPGMTADEFRDHDSGEVLNDLYRASRAASGSDDDEEAATIFDTPRLRALSEAQATVFRSAALGLADQLRSSTLDPADKMAIGSNGQEFERKLGRQWGASVKAIVDKGQSPYNPAELRESTARYVARVRHGIELTVTDAKPGAMDSPFVAVLEMASIIVTQAGFTLRNRQNGRNYMEALTTDLRDVLSVSTTTDSSGDIGAFMNPLSTRAQLTKGLTTLISQSSARTPEKAVRQVAAMHTSGFLKVFADKWTVSRVGETNFFRDTAGLYVSGMIGVLIMRDLAALAATFDNLSQVWHLHAIPAIDTALVALKF